MGILRPIGAAGLRVLFVEPDDLVAIWCEEQLAEVGCHVVATPLKEYALRLAGAHAFDVAVISGGMACAPPGALLTQFRQTAPRLGLVIFTGSRPAWPGQEAVAGLPDGSVMLAKPCAELDLVDAIVRAAANGLSRPAWA
jgi:DNA-binding NtrC family response regulator